MATGNRSQFEDAGEAAGLSHRSSSDEGQNESDRASRECKDLDPDGTRTDSGTSPERELGRATAWRVARAGFVDPI